MIVSISGRGIHKLIASVYEVDGEIVLRIDGEDNSELWVELRLASRRLPDGIFQGGKFVEEGKSHETDLFDGPGVAHVDHRRASSG